MKKSIKIIFKKNSFIKEEKNQFGNTLTSREFPISNLPLEMRNAVSHIEDENKDRIECTLQMLRKAYKLFAPVSMQFIKRD
jgi:hypothetical protein